MTLRTPGTPTPAEFDLHFNALAYRATHPPVHVDTQWFQISEVAKTGELRTSVYQLTDIGDTTGRQFEPTPETPLPDWLVASADMTYTLRYNRQQRTGLADPTAPQPITRKRYGRKVGSIIDILSPGLVRQLTIGRACLYFSQIAPDFASVNTVIRTYSDIARTAMSEALDDNESTDLGRHAATRGLNLIAAPSNAESLDAAQSFTGVLAHLDTSNPHHSALLYGVRENVGQAITGSELSHGRTKSTVTPVMRQAAIGLARQMEEKGLLNAQWWAQYGIREGAVHRDMELLATAYEKIAGEN